MHGNRVKEKLNEGQIALVVGGHSNTPHTIDFLGPLGFDGFWLEGEHGTITWDNIDDLSRACDLWNMASITRVQTNEPSLITRTLDRGANGIVVPHINTRAEAEQVVQAARFGPLGQRGIYYSRRAYGNPDFFHRANDETLVVILIEETRAIDNLSEILTVDGIDVFFVAPGDLSQSMGFLGQPNHPEVQAVVEESFRQIVAAGRVAGAIGAEDDLERYTKLGVRFFLLSFDSWIQAGAVQYQAKVEAVTADL